MVGVLAVVMAWIALGLAGTARAEQLGRSDACPPPSGDRNVIISDGDEPVMRGTAASDLICGDSGRNLIIGGLLDDEIYGGGGADILLGGHGTDVLDGGSGSDWLRGGDGQDCYEAGVEYARTVDTVSFADATPTNEVAVSGVVVDLSAPDAVLEGIVPPSCELHGFDTPAPGRALGQGPNEELNHIDRVIGSSFDDTITAGAERLAASGGFGDDVLNGTGGDDNLWGDGGLDRCTNDGATGECLNGVPEAHRSAGALVFAESRLEGTDFGLVVLGAEGTANDTLVVTRANERKLRVIAGTNLAPGSPNCRRGANERIVDCEFSAARYVVVWGDAGDDVIDTAGDLSNDGHGTLDANGGPGNDELTGHGSDDVLFTGEGGRDRLTGNGGNDALISEGDPLDGTTNGADTLDGGDGNDQLVSDNACAGHTFEGGRGDDILGFARQTLVGEGPFRRGVYATLGEGETNGRAYAHDGLSSPLERCAISTTVPDIETLEGTNQYDLLFGNSNDNTLWGRADSDRLNGLGGNDTIKAQDGNDLVRAGFGADVISGGPGQDEIYGEDGADTILGQGGADSLYGEAGADRIDGEAAVDRLFGGGEDDTLLGDGDNDLLQGDGGLDWLYGGDGSDTLRARDGSVDNAIDCGNGSDPGAERDSNDPAGVSCND